MSNVAPELALMIGLGVGIDYALFIVTRFRENYSRFGDVERSVVEAMDTSGRAILLAGTTVVIALLGMFATGVSFMYGLAIASVLAVLLTLAASLTVLPAMLSRSAPVVGAGGTRRRRFRAPPPGACAPRIAPVRPRFAVAALERDGAGAAVAAGDRSRWRDAGAALCRCSRCGWTPATPATTRRTRARARRSTCSPRASGRASTARC